MIGDMLLVNNEMPLSMYEAKKTLNALGMGYEKIHACPMIAFYIEMNINIYLYVQHVEYQGGRQTKIALRRVKWFLEKCCGISHLHQGLRGSFSLQK